jgi:hypothetical protein
VQRHELEHIIRAAAAVTNRYEFVIVGSQSILGSVSNPPTECVLSMEADIFPLGAEELSGLIDGALGEGSPFHDQFGYYAQGVDSTIPPIFSSPSVPPTETRIAASTALC